MNLDDLVGRRIEDIFLGLVDYICPDGGSVDEGIARDAFIETITDLADSGIVDLDSLNSDQVRTVFELYASNAIEARLCNDIGAKTVSLPSNIRDAQRVQAQLHDFIRRGVADALAAADVNVAGMTPAQVNQLVEQVYEQAFEILKYMADREAESQ